MTLVLVGISHRGTPVEVRERVRFGRATAARELAASLAAEGEAVCLSTCNRTELYLVGEDAEAAGPRRRWSRSAAWRASSCARVVYRLADEAAALHLFRVAAGLDSMVPGEGEILGQVRAAYEAGATGPVLDRLFRQALHAGKKVRTETAIAESPASVSSAAAALAQQVFGELDGLPGAARRRRQDRASWPRGASPRAAPRSRSSPTARRARRGARARFGGEALALERAAEELGESTSSSRRPARRATCSCASEVEAALRAPAGAAAVPDRPRRAARPRSGDPRARRLLPLRHRRPRGGGRREPRRPPPRGGARRGDRRRGGRAASAPGRPRSTSSRRSRRCARARRRSARRARARAAGASGCPSSRRRRSSRSPRRSSTSCSTCRPCG